jgi:hypothetical protein
VFEEKGASAESVPARLSLMKSGRRSFAVGRTWVWCLAAKRTCREAQRLHNVRPRGRVMAQSAIGPETEYAVCRGASPVAEAEAPWFARGLAAVG